MSGNAELDVRVAVLEADHRSHKLSDDERYGRIDTTMTQIMDKLTDIGRKLDAGLTRAHERIDEEAAETRHRVNGAVMAVDAKLATADKRASAADERLSTLQIKCLTAGIGLLVMVVGFFVVPFFKGH